MDTKPPSPAAETGPVASDANAPLNPPPSRQLPFSKWAPVIAGALFGVFLRLIFSGGPGRNWAPMSVAFFYFVPFAVGAVTVYVAERTRRRSWGYYIGASAGATALFVLGTLLIMIEGMICAVVIVPIFAVWGALGGLLMGIICRFTLRGTGAVYSIAALPLLLGMVPTDESDRQLIGTIERTIVVNASPEKIWHQLHHTTQIRPDEVDSAWMYKIGVPLPVAGVTHHTPAGPVRHVTMGKSIHFEQVAAAWQEHRHVRWSYRFSEDSFPAGALDDHVKIGGHYFDLLDTSYTLSPAGPQATTLNITMRYRVSTQFNWYAEPLARWLIGNFEEVALRLYAQRAEDGAD